MKLYKNVTDKFQTTNTSDYLGINWDDYSQFLRPQMVKPRIQRLRTACILFMTFLLRLLVTEKN